MYVYNLRLKSENSVKLTCFQKLSTWGKVEKFIFRIYSYLICFLLRIPNVFGNVLNGFAQAGIGFHCLFGLADGVNNGGVISSAEFVTDGSHAHLGDVLDNVHCNLTGAADVGGALVALYILFGNVKGAGNLCMICPMVTGTGWLSLRISRIAFCAIRIVTGLFS